MVDAAVRFGMKQIGFSEHAPVPLEVLWSMKEPQVREYCETINRLKKQTDIEVLSGIEADFISGMSRDFKRLKKEMGLDYVIGSVHLVKPMFGNRLWFIDGPAIHYEKGLKQIFGSNPKLAVSTYYRQIRAMVATQRPDIVAHLDKVRMNNQQRFFSEDELWYIEEVDRTLEAIKRAGVIVEVNTRGLYKGKTDDFFPNVEILKKCRELEIPVTISTDAHLSTELVSKYDEACLILQNIGFEGIYVYNAGSWVLQSF